MFQKSDKLPEYLGRMIVCLNKARPFSQVPNGRAIIGGLTQVKIKTSNVKNQRNSNTNLYSEKDIAVPVYISNKDITAIDRSDDWTNKSSPVSEIKYAPIARWWPRSLFRGSQKIGDIAEEIHITFPKFSAKLDVNYAFTSDLKQRLFEDIENVNVPCEENIDVENPEEDEDPVMTYIVDPEDDFDKEEDFPQPPPPANFEEKCSSPVIREVDKITRNDELKKKEKGRVSALPLKVALGIFGFAALSFGVYFCVKWFNRSKH
jgi:hypothetical protein